MSRRYRSGNYQDAYLGSIEQAAEIACSQLLKLKAEGTHFSRVFVSTLENGEKAKRDLNSFSYSFK